MSADGSQRPKVEVGAETSQERVADYSAARGFESVASPYRQGFLLHLLLSVLTLEDPPGVPEKICYQDFLPTTQ